MLVTAADVLHAWWVPAFAVKKDAVPGFINESWFTADTEGTYRGQCAELCGMDHGFMPIVVRVASQEDYDVVAHVAASASELAGSAMTAAGSLGRTERNKEDLA